MATQPKSDPILDHIVILVPHKDLDGFTKKLEDTLTVIDGGAHADGLTVNKLIILADGVYLELIAFQPNADPEKRKQHRWGQLEEGAIIDWAHTLPHESEFGAVQERVRDADTKFAYQDPVAGGRIKPDGTNLKWSVAAIKDESGNIWPGYAPFWCFDRTPRRLRVPYQGENDDGSLAGPLAHTQHPSGVRGVARVRVSLPEKDIEAFRPVYNAVHDTDSGAGVKFEAEEWDFKVPSGAKQGEQKVSITSFGSVGKFGLHLTLLGDKDSPKSIEVLPGLVFDVEPVE